MTQPPPDYDKDKPIRLALAARIAFPDGSIGPKGLRKERDAGRLQTEIIARKEYTTLAAIERMRELCRVTPKAPAASSATNGGTNPSGARRDGLSLAEYGLLAQAAASASLKRQIDSSREASRRKRKRPPKD